MNREAVRAINRIPKTLVYKRTASYNNAGQADISGCSHGIRIELEGKLPDEKLEPLQSYWQNKWGKVDAIIGRYETKEEAVAIIITKLLKRGIINVQQAGDYYITIWGSDAIDKLRNGTGIRRLETP